MLKKFSNEDWGLTKIYFWNVYLIFGISDTVVFSNKVFYESMNKSLISDDAFCWLIEKSFAYIEILQEEPLEKLQKLKISF